MGVTNKKIAVASTNGSLGANEVQLKHSSSLQTDSKEIVGAINEVYQMSGGIPDAPTDGKTYGRENGSWAQVAKTDGFYEQMGVGVARSLMGNGASVSAEFTRRTSGGSADIGGSVATLKEIKGNTIVWNQLIDDPNFADVTKWKPLQCTVSLNDNVASMTVTDDSIASSLYNKREFGLNNNHKYYIKFEINPSISQRCAALLSNIRLEQNNLNANGWNKIAAIGISESNVSTYLQLYLASSPVGTTWKLRNIVVTDLTKMFGAGNEPSSVAEFEALFPNSYYPYNGGELVSLTAQNLVTEGLNCYNPNTGKARVLGYLTSSQGQSGTYQIVGAYTSLTLDGETITPDTNGFFTPSKSGDLVVSGGNSTTCIKLVWSGQKNGQFEPYWQEKRTLNLTTLKGKVNGEGESVVIFPNGLQSAGTAHDEIVGNKAIKRCGVVDLGTLDWNKGTLSNDFYRVDVNGKKYGYWNLVCAKYVTTTGTQGSSVAPGYISGGGTSNSIFIGEPIGSYPDAAAFKAAMSGVFLFFELATPTEYVIDDEDVINPNYRVDDYGTEEIEPLIDEQGEPTSAPLKAEIVYAPNVPDTLRRLPQNYVSIVDYKSGIGNLASALGTSLGKTIAVTWGGDNGSVPSFTITDNQ